MSSRTRDGRFTPLRCSARAVQVQCRILHSLLPHLSGGQPAWPRPVPSLASSVFPGVDSLMRRWMLAPAHVPPGLRWPARLSSLQSNGGWAGPFGRPGRTSIPAQDGAQWKTSVRLIPYESAARRPYCLGLAGILAGWIVPRCFQSGCSAGSSRAFCRISMGAAGTASCSALWAEA